MTLYESFIKVFHVVNENIFSTNFNISEKKDIDNLSKINKDIIFEFDFINYDFEQKVYYFIDKKFARNLFSYTIDDIPVKDMETDLTPKIISSLNEKVIHKIKNDLKIDCYIKNEQLLADIKNEINLSLYYLSSLKGNIFVGFLNKVKTKIEENLYSSKKFSGNYQNQIIQIKEKKDESSLISTVQLLEIKKQVLMTLSEIKDLKGDPDFLLRKAKTVSELSRLWFDITKEEH
ncbi:MAG: hypothetical protein U0354_13185 [Candidatus Sericytochromatia bacterium]